MTFDITKKWRWLVALGAVFVPALVTGAGSVKVPHKFTAGSAIKAQEMNDNISSLKKAIDGKGAVAPSVIGTLTIAGVPQTIPIRRFAHKLSNTSTVSGGGGGAGRAEVGDLEVAFGIGDMSPTLNQAVNQGNHFQNANIVIGSLAIRVEDLLITSVLVDDLADTVPLQEIGIGFSLIEWTWQPPGQASRVVTWNRSTNQGSGSGPGVNAYAFFGPGVTQNPSFVAITGYHSDQRCPEPTTTPGGPACRVGHSPFLINKAALGADLLDDLASVTRGVHLASADIQWQIAGLDGAMVLQHRTRLEDYVVTSVDVSTATNGNLVESVGLTYGRIRWTVGNRETGWDLAANQPF